MICLDGATAASAFAGHAPVHIMGSNADISCICYTVCHTTATVVVLGAPLLADGLVGLVVKAPALGAEDPEFESLLRRDFSWWSHTSDFKIGTPVATLPGAWRCRVSAGTGRPGVSKP